MSVIQSSGMALTSELADAALEYLRGVKRQGLVDVIADAVKSHPVAETAAEQLAAHAGRTTFRW